LVWAADITIDTAIAVAGNGFEEELSKARPDESPAGFLLATFAVPVLTGSMTDVVKQLETYLRKKPLLGQGVYIAQSAVVIGDVTLGDHSSVWHNAVLRGDINRIVVGHHTNIQDNAVLHLADDYPCLVGDYVTIGHSAIVHACTVGNEVLIGMGAIILDGAMIGEKSLIGADALVTQKTQIPPRSLVLGSPAKAVRALTAEELEQLRASAEKYAQNAAYCLKHAIHAAI
jgi:carbonic anhydrase/acetyltransferase-like protein (isoleucine patch superfamily)